MGFSYKKLLNKGGDHGLYCGVFTYTPRLCGLEKGVRKLQLGGFIKQEFKKNLG